MARSDYKVSINSPSGEGGGPTEQGKWETVNAIVFPLILLQAKAGGPSLLRSYCRS